MTGYRIGALAALDLPLLAGGAAADHAAVAGAVALCELRGAP